MNYIESLGDGGCFVHLFVCFCCFNRPYFCFWIFPQEPQNEFHFQISSFDLWIPRTPFPVLLLVSQGFIPILLSVLQTRFGCVQVAEGQRGKRQGSPPKTFNITVPLVGKDSCISKKDSCILGTCMVTAATELQHQEWKLPGSRARKERKKGVRISHIMSAH